MTPEMRCNIFRRGAGAGAGGTGSLVVPSQAASYITGMGKGLREPCSPFREANVFGAELRAPNANNWNFVAEIVDPTASFDLSTIEPNHEVVVALVALYNLLAGKSYSVTHRWYRDRDDKLLFEFPYQIPDPGIYGYASWAWYYVYSYIGYVPAEIYENGSYHVDIWLDQSLLQRIGFTVSGIPQLEPQITQFTIVDYSKV